MWKVKMRMNDALKEAAEIASKVGLPLGVTDIFINYPTGNDELDKAIEQSGCLSPNEFGKEATIVFPKDKP